MVPNDPLVSNGHTRIAFFYPWGNLGAFTSLRDCIVLLVEHGFDVDFFTQIDNSYPVPGLDLPGFTVFNRPEASLFFTYSFPWVVHRFNKGGRPWEWLEMNFIRPMKRHSFYNFVRARHASKPYICLFGMDPEGLVSAEPLGKLLGVPLIYWSLELLFKGELVTSKHIDLKTMEINASKQAVISITQDQWRGQALIDENGLNPSWIFHVPNAPRGKARREKSDYLHRRFNIAPERKIILCAGSIARWSMAMEIVAASVGWPDDFVLVMQSRKHNNGHQDEYLNNLIKLADPEKVIISFDPIPESDFCHFVDSADIGLAFYTPILTQLSTTNGKNVYLMGLSSGKIASYLHSGLPIIVNDAVIGPGELIKTTQCGICLKKPHEIKDALVSIFDKYDWYSANACRCFDQELELEKHLSSVIEQINVLNSNQANRTQR